MHRHRCILAAAALLAAAPAARAQAPARTVAVTFDDLPVASRHVADAAGQRAITARLLAALRRHRVPATGFVNEAKLERWDGAVDSARVAILRMWVREGLALGNHTRSHPDLHRVPTDSFLADVDRGDAVTRRLLAEAGSAPRWFRHPFLHTGRSVAVRDSVTAHLARRGYRVAPVTIDGYDYMFSAAYDAALARADSAEAARVADAYAAYMERVVTYWEGQSRAIEGREIPQVLLLHANALNADGFDRLAAMLRARGYAFAPLADVVADPAYRSADAYDGPAGISWLHRWAITRGLPRTIFAGEPTVPADIRAVAERPAGPRGR